MNTSVTFSWLPTWHHQHHQHYQHRPYQHHRPTPCFHWNLWSFSCSPYPSGYLWGELVPVLPNFNCYLCVKGLRCQKKGWWFPNLTFLQFAQHQDNQEWRIKIGLFVPNFAQLAPSLCRQQNQLGQTRKFFPKLSAGRQRGDIPKQAWPPHIYPPPPRAPGAQNAPSLSPPSLSWPLPKPLMTPTLSEHLILVLLLLRCSSSLISLIGPFSPD